MSLQDPRVDSREYARAEAALDTQALPGFFGCASLTSE